MSVLDPAIAIIGVDKAKSELCILVNLCMLEEMLLFELMLVFAGPGNVSVLIFIAVLALDADAGVDPIGLPLAV